jgi:hypothetical protein
MGTSLVETVNTIVKLGQEQYETFIKERFVERSKPISDPITKNKLSLFSRPDEKTKPKQKTQIAALRDDCSLFSRLYIACQSRDGNLSEFFSHENQPYPPSLSKCGEMRQGDKADLLLCLQGIKECTDEAPKVDAKILDGAVLVQMMPPKTATTFQEYSEDVFLPYIIQQLQSVSRVDVVWDVYRIDSLKKRTRQKRGTGTRKRVVAEARLPVNWKSFLRVDENKTELFQYLSQQIVSLHFDDKEIYSTYGEQVLSSPERQNLSVLQPCSHEEADTRLILHTFDAAQEGCQRIMIRTTDTDVVVLAISQVHNISASELWIAFGVGKHFRYIPAHEISRQLGPQKATALPMLHALSGCDVTSFFCGKGKKSAWDTWSVSPEVTDTLVMLASKPDVISEDNMDKMERFIVHMYDRTSEHTTVNEARQQLFSKSSKTIEILPPCVTSTY